MESSKTFENDAALIKSRVFKIETLAKVLSCEFCEISMNTFLQNISGRLLLKYVPVIDRWKENIIADVAVNRCSSN